MSDDKVRQNTIWTNFFSPQGLDVEKIAKNQTNCQTRLFEVYTLYNPRMQARMDQLKKLGTISAADLQTLLAPVPPQASFANVEAMKSYYSGRIETIVTKTVSNIIQEVIQAYANMGWVCNDR